MTVNSHEHRHEDRPHADRPMYESTPVQAVDFSELVASVARLVTAREHVTFATGTICTDQVPRSLKDRLFGYNGAQYNYTLGPAVHSPAGEAPAVFILAQLGARAAKEIRYEMSGSAAMPQVGRIENDATVDAGFYEADDVISCIAAIGAASIFEE